ncbi:hypothetical protein KP509_28G067500 [Ceratopteris richardii]|nr:hypothetical protein KP509_28G067500 [Ceratopteris richardii]
MHSGQSPDIAKRSEMPISSALLNNSKQKADESAVPDIQVHDHTSEVSFTVVSDRMAAKGNSFEEVASPNTSHLSPLKTGRTEREWKTGCENKPVAGKEYVLDWLDSELHVDGQGSPEVMRDENLGLKTGNGKSRLGMVEVHTEEIVKDKKRTRDPSRKGREWWKDEYFAELGGKAESDAVTVKKSGKHRNFESWKDYLSAEFTGFSGDLRADARSTRFSGRSCSKEWMRSSRSGDLSFYGPIERQRVPSIVSDMCSEDRRLQFSSELVNGQWSGELTKSGELVIKDASSTTSMRGTVCYVAPENGGNGILSEKSDIYSFGVLMLVILSGRRPIQVTATPMKEFERANLISWARNLSQNGKLLDLMDEKLSGDFDREEALLCITLALLCLQRVPSTRPHISEIVKILCRQMAVPNLPLELSPSPPARTPYKVSSFSPKEHSVQSRPITSSTDSTSVMTSSML